MMEGIFSRNNNQVLFTNIAPTIKENELYQLTEPGIFVVEANTSTNQDDFDNFSSTPPLVSHKRPNQDVGSVPAKSPKKSKIEVYIDTTINQVLDDVNNLSDSHSKDKEGDTFLEPNVVTHLHDTSNIVQDSDIKVCQKHEHSNVSTVHKIDTPQGFKIPDDLLPSQFLESMITIRCPTGLNYATPIQK
ncbi:hypothetical protein HAX54_043275 [Datura stramonium]|uniref:Reverse transcriptase domain-containing protein n=1 Tax=Datura stramonium TaxID=4076 RepID=A0ABS8W253_DATST|nr:hypothetical protein [Datura stramonium]